MGAFAADEPSVLVIGAGPAGISTAYYLERAGIPYRVLDRDLTPASTWANLYESLRLNTAGFVSHLPGRRLPLRYGIYPSGRQYYAYLSAYLRDHCFAIDLGVDVKRVAPTDSGTGWQVETSAGAQAVPAVVIATGRFCNPYLPEIPGRASFRGQFLHASAYRRPEDFAGKHVLVVGSGPSGGDIAVDLARSAATPVRLAIRSDLVIARSYPYGLPTTAWVLLAELLPKRWRKGFLNRVSYQTYPGQEHLGLPLAPNRDDRSGTSAPVRGPELIREVKAGRIRPVAGLARLNETSAVLMDGSEMPADAVILCTGYRPAIDYLDVPYETDADGWMVRRSEDSQQVKDYPGLYLVGRFYRGLGPLHNIRREARIAVDEISSYLAERAGSVSPIDIIEGR
ncbi:MAG: NAD(P)/FAD-dependent oxidoreductase [Chloroflexi bacterium]|nr:NAD(P)/FAD-dependent oxidoreductase [Chloroflexota bacterium]